MQRASSLASVLLLGACTLLLAGCGGPNLIEMVDGYSFAGLGICGTIIVILDIIALVEIGGSTKSTGSKVLWILLIIFFPLGGLIIYWLFGKE
ncbi:MAG: PLDc N-terminal domain-containing protein [Rhodothermales bacterium]